MQIVPSGLTGSSPPPLLVEVVDCEQEQQRQLEEQAIFYGSVELILAILDRKHQASQGIFSSGEPQLISFRWRQTFQGGTGPATWEGAKLA